VLEDSEIIARIYEAAVVPEFWGGRGVLDILAEVSDCTDGVLLALDKKGLNGWIANECSTPKMDVYIGENWVAQNPYLEKEERIARFSEPRFLLDTEIMSAEEMQASEYYQRFMRPYGVYWTASTSITGPTDGLCRRREQWSDDVYCHAGKG
jgi:hypothetical protein